MGENAAAFDILFYSFTMDVPRAEICCEIGRLFMEKREYVTAAYWYQQALLAPRKKKTAVFILQTVMILYLRYRCVYVWIKREGTGRRLNFIKRQEY